MDTISINIVGELLKQGPVITVLIMACWYFYKQQIQMQAQLKSYQDKHDADMLAASDKLEKYMTDDREILITALNNNTKVMEDIQKYLDGKNS